MKPKAFSFSFTNIVDMELQNYFYDDILHIIFSYTSLSSLDVLHYYPEVQLWDSKLKKIYEVYSDIICWGLCPFLEGEDPLNFYRIHNQGVEDAQNNISYTHPPIRIESWNRECNYNTVLLEGVHKFLVSFKLPPPSLTYSNSLNFKLDRKKSDFQFQYTASSTFYLVQDDPSEYLYYSFPHSKWKSSNNLLFPNYWWKTVCNSPQQNFEFLSNYDEELHDFMVNEKKYFLKEIN